MRAGGADDDTENGNDKIESSEEVSGPGRTLLDKKLLRPVTSKTTGLGRNRRRLHCFVSAIGDLSINGHEGVKDAPAPADDYTQAHLPDTPQRQLTEPTNAPNTTQSLSHTMEWPVNRMEIGTTV